MIETHREERRANRSRGALVFTIIAAAVFLSHLPLLRLPYIWDEAGYYIPATRDLLLTGSLIPHSTVSNAHPPLVMAWVALWWKTFGTGPMVTRAAMLVLASFSVMGIFRLAKRAANTQVAVASTICVACYSVFFTQSSLVHLDLAAAGLTFWGLHSYVENRRWIAIGWFSAASLAKETAILAPVGLLAWEVLGPLLGQKTALFCFYRGTWKKSSLLLVSLLPLTAWFGYHYSRTGYVFGNPEFFRYNVAATIDPVRILLAAGIRLWQVTGYLHLFLLTIMSALAMLFPPCMDGGVERPRIAISVQLVFAAVILTYVVAMSIIGGAELARYMLPAVPLVIIVCVSTLWRRVRRWKTTMAVLLLGFIAAWFVNPPYGFSFEDNLAYRDYILLHRDAEQFLENRYPTASVLTAWPASDELTHPYLGYLDRPMKVVRIENFAYTEIASAAELRSQFDVALVFSTKYLPPGSLLARWPAWERLQTRYFGFHRDMPPAAAAQILGGHIVYTAARKGQWIAIIEMDRVVDAKLMCSPEKSDSPSLHSSE
jgi:Dolichyl-phosphate-mannose-protein mannosyltransferase